MPAGTIIGATEVRGGHNSLIAISTQGNYENHEIDLVFASAAAMSNIQRGANYTLIDAGGTRYGCVAKSLAPAERLASFAVAQ